MWGWEGLWRVGIPGLLTSLLLIPRRTLAPPPRPALGIAVAVRDALVGTLATALLSMYLFVVVRGTVQLIFVGFLPLYMIDTGMSVEAAGGALSLFLAAGSLGSVTGGVGANRRKPCCVV